MTDQGSKRLRVLITRWVGKALLSLMAVIVLIAGAALLLRYRFHSSGKATEYVAVGSSFAAGQSNNWLLC